MYFVRKAKTLIRVMDKSDGYYLVKYICCSFSWVLKWFSMFASTILLRTTLAVVVTARVAARTMSSFLVVESNMIVPFGLCTGVIISHVIWANQKALIRVRDKRLTGTIQ